MSIVYLRILILSDLEHALQVTTFSFVIGPPERNRYLIYLLIAFLDMYSPHLKNAIPGNKDTSMTDPDSHGFRMSL
jgi:hypothetical protein